MIRVKRDIKKFVGIFIHDYTHVQIISKVNIILVEITFRNIIYWANTINQRKHTFSLTERNGFRCTISGCSGHWGKTGIKEFVSTQQLNKELRYLLAIDIGSYCFPLAVFVFKLHEVCTDAIFKSKTHISITLLQVERILLSAGEKELLFPCAMELCHRGWQNAIKEVSVSCNPKLRCLTHRVAGWGFTYDAGSCRMDA